MRETVNREIVNRKTEKPLFFTENAEGAENRVKPRDGPSATTPEDRRGKP